jgi:hypothetical protein
MYELGADQSYWTPEYAMCYILAPFIGAFLAGNVFGYQKRLYLRIEHNLHEDESEEETQQQLKSKKTMKLQRVRTNQNHSKISDNSAPFQTERSLLTQNSERK